MFTIGLREFKEVNKKNNSAVDAAFKKNKKDNKTIYNSNIIRK